MCLERPIQYHNYPDEGIGYRMMAFDDRPLFYRRLATGPVKKGSVVVDESTFQINYGDYNQHGGYDSGIHTFVSEHTAKFWRSISGCSQAFTNIWKVKYSGLRSVGEQILDNNGRSATVLVVKQVEYIERMTSPMNTPSKRVYTCL